VSYLAQEVVVDALDGRGPRQFIRVTRHGVHVGDFATVAAIHDHGRPIDLADVEVI
jgi:hypothetical protein